MKFQPTNILPLGVAIIALLSSAIPAQALTYYWDTDGNGTAGFGTASGTWGTDSFWSQDSTGAGVSPTANPTTASTNATTDAVHFGTATNGLGAGTINGPAVAQGFGAMTFGAASGAIVLSGGTLNMFNGAAIQVNNSTATISSLLQGGSFTKNGTGKLILSGPNTFNGAVTIDAGTISVSSISNSGIGNAQALGTGTTIQIGSSATAGVLEYTGSTNSTTNKQVRVGRSNNTGQVGGATILNNGTGSLTFTNAAFNLTTAGQAAVRTLTLGGTYSDGFNEIQGTIQNAAAAVASPNNAANAVTVSGSKWNLSGTNTYTGATNVTGGTLLINGSTSTSSAVAVSSGATLGGTGRAGGTVSVATDGILSPGASIESFATGALTMAANSTFAYEIANNTSTGADLLAVNGTLALSGVILSFDLATLAALEGGGWGNGDTLTLMSYSGTAITAGFNGYTDDATYTFGSNDWVFNYNDLTAGGNYASDATLDGQNNFITMTYTVVPEPSSTLLGGLGLLALLLRRRR